MQRESARDDGANARALRDEGANARALRDKGANARAPAMTVLTLYSKPDCHLCVDAREALEGLQSELGFAISEVDITTDDRLHRAYFERIPVVALGEEELSEYFVNEQALRERFRAIL